MSVLWRDSLGETLSARSACCYLATSVSEPLFLHNERLSVAPASLTKVLAAITALQIQPDITLKLIMREGEETPGSGNNLMPGDTLTLWDALHNMLIPSSNVSATIVARTMGERLLALEGGEGDPRQRFVQQMNRVAMSLGMFRSRFINAHGLAARGQVTCARDIARLGLAALHYPAITDIWGKRRYTLSLEGSNPRQKRIISSLTFVETIGAEVLGGKTGTLGAALNHLLVYTRAPGGANLISVVLHASSNEGRYADMKTMLTAVHNGYRWPQCAPTLIEQLTQ